MLNFLTRLKYAWAVLTGKIILPAQLEEMNFMVALTQTAAALAALSTAANELISYSSTTSTALTSAQNELDSADTDTASKIDDVTSTITAALPTGSVVSTGSGTSGTTDASVASVLPAPVTTTAGAPVTGPDTVITPVGTN